MGIGMVTAAAVDETGAPVAGQPAMVCGLDLCSPASLTDSTGKVSVGGMQALPKKPAFRIGDGVAYTHIAIPLTAFVTDFSAGGKTLTLGKLSNKPGAPLTPGTSPSSGGVTLALAAGTAVGIDTLTYDTADRQMFRAVRVPVAGLAEWLGAVQLGGAPAGFVLFYGVTPLETTFCPPAQVTVALPHATSLPNDLGWAPGTAVELWITTSDVGQGFAPYAGWRKMSDAVVSSDGASITTPPGQGFSTLENFAVRKAP
jgi:hypothetical protein